MSFFELFNPSARFTREQREADKVRSLERKQSAPPQGSGMVDFDDLTLRVVVPPREGGRGPEDRTGGLADSDPTG